jgi:hypothetical protein
MTILIVVGSEQRTVDDFFDTLVVTMAEVAHGLAGAPCVEQAFAVRVFTETDQDLAVALRQTF